MTIIRPVPSSAAEGTVRDMYEQVRAEHGYLDPTLRQALTVGRPVAVS